ncbi:response regulator [Reichenbachiella agarivorans]|uniref:Response regulator n=1 Tax=Reichenbachiella agarivorans TaxID=2979464 RepID=A0ABY6CPU4_9BACT|nr:response regulator [Reichenbachiella agarivorans]UXP32536.1 response regulator [Reichenbachiella agarivorans]
MRALIVDDEEDIGWMVSKFLQSEGLEVEYVSRIEKAQYKINEHPYEVYFLDLNLPDGSGFDLIPSIRKQEIDSKVVVISAHDGIYEINQAKEMNVDLFIKKPFTKKQVVDAIEDLK